MLDKFAKLGINRESVKSGRLATEATWCCCDGPASELDGNFRYFASSIVKGSDVIELPVVLKILEEPKSCLVL